MYKDVIICYASRGREDYEKKMLNLIRSIKNTCPDVDCIFWSESGYVDEYLGYEVRKGLPVSKNFISYHHSEIPYHFKLSCIDAALSEGYNRIFWLDSAIKVLKNPFELFDIPIKVEGGEIKRSIVAFDNVGHPLKNYISDLAVDSLNVSNLDKIPQTMGGLVGYDFTDHIANMVFYQMERNSLLFKDGGSSRPEFVAHRHDQAVLSVLLYQQCIDLLPYGLVTHPELLKEHPNAYLQLGNE